jgi:hypothetical protein
MNLPRGCLRVCVHTPVKENRVWVCCRDIDPGALAKVSKERAFFNVAKTNGPRYRSTHTSATPDLKGNARPVVQAQKARLAETRLLPSLFFCKLPLLPLFSKWHFDCRGSFSSEVRPEMPITGIALRGRLGSTYICYRCAIIIGTVDGRYVGNLAIECLQSASMK